MNGQYILNGKTPVECNDLMEWAKQMEGKNRIVEQSQFENVKVSTVFLGLDHSFGDGEPLLFETMIFGGEHDQYQDRYSTWDEAVEGHKKACELVSLV
jgi:hypothetical protein